MTSDAVGLDREARRARGRSRRRSFIVQAPAGSGKTSAPDAALPAPARRRRAARNRSSRSRSRARRRRRCVTASSRRSNSAREPLAAGCGRAHVGSCTDYARGGARAQPRARLGTRAQSGAPARADDRRPQSLARAAIAAGGAHRHCRRRSSTMRARCTRRRRGARSRCWTRRRRSPAGLERLARALNHEPRQLAELVEGMLGARELWLPKLLQPAPTGVAARGDRPAAAQGAGNGARRGGRAPRGHRLAGRCSRSAARRPRPARRRARRGRSRRMRACRRRRRMRRPHGVRSRTCC